MFGDLSNCHRVTELSVDATSRNDIVETATRCDKELADLSLPDIGSAMNATVDLTAGHGSSDQKLLTRDAGDYTEVGNDIVNTTFDMAPVNMDATFDCATLRTREVMNATFDKMDDDIVSNDLDLKEAEPCGLSVTYEKVTDAESCGQESSPLPSVGSREEGLSVELSTHGSIEPAGVSIDGVDAQLSFDGRNLGKYAVIVFTSTLLPTHDVVSL